MGGKPTSGCLLKTELGSSGVGDVALTARDQDVCALSPTQRDDIRLSADAAVSQSHQPTLAAWSQQVGKPGAPRSNACAHRFIAQIDAPHFLGAPIIQWIGLDAAKLNACWRVVHGREDFATHDRWPACCRGYEQTDNCHQTKPSHHFSPLTCSNNDTPCTGVSNGSEAGRRLRVNSGRLWSRSRRF